MLGPEQYKIIPQSGILHYPNGQLNKHVLNICLNYGGKTEIVKACKELANKVKNNIISIDDIPKEIIKTLGKGHSERINNMVTSVILESTDKNYIMMSSEIGQATNELRAFLFDNVYRNKIAKAEEDKAIEMLRILFEYFAKHPYEMPEIYRKNLKNEDVARCVCDYISSMTDRYAIDLFRELYVPAMWRRHL